ncbi:MAG: hypothetical protein MRY83_17005 [Flavobacteriales bacterium]|nr:hypothetical protein [Flavobacteriales bacterium]
MNLLPNKLDEQSSQRLKDLEEALDEISVGYDLEPGNGSIHFDHFYLFDKKDQIKLMYQWDVSKNNTGFQLFMYEFHQPKSKNQIAFFGHLNSKIDFGKTLIRPETLQDKIAEIFQPVEIDFATHAKFSREFYVLTLDEDLLRANFPLKLMDYLVEVPKSILEFSNYSCVFSFNSFQKKDILQLVDVGMNLSEILN